MDTRTRSAVDNQGELAHGRLEHVDPPEPLAMRGCRFPSVSNPSSGCAPFIRIDHCLKSGEIDAVDFAFGEKSTLSTKRSTAMMSKRRYITLNDSCELQSETVFDVFFTVR